MFAPTICVNALFVCRGDLRSPVGLILLRQIGLYSYLDCAAFLCVRGVKIGAAVLKLLFCCDIIILTRTV
mgnify:CR=1 FL=1